MLDDYSDYIIEDENEFYIDRLDSDTEDEIVQPGETVTFTWEGKDYKAIVTEQAEGRDDDIYKLKIIN